MKKTKINLNFLFVASTLITLIFVILAYSGRDSTFLPVIAFPFYLFYSVASQNTHDPYGAGVGAGIFLSIFGPIVVFVAWLIVLDVLQYIYYTVIKKQTVSVRDTGVQKKNWKTSTTLIVCILAVIIMDILFVMHQ